MVEGGDVYGNLKCLSFYEGSSIFQNGFVSPSLWKVLIKKDLSSKVTPSKFWLSFLDILTDLFRAIQFIFLFKDANTF